MNGAGKIGHQYTKSNNIWPLYYTHNWLKMDYRFKHETVSYKILEENREKVFVTLG